MQLVTFDTMWLFPISVCVYRHVCFIHTHLIVYNMLHKYVNAKKEAFLFYNRGCWFFPLKFTSIIFPLRKFFLRTLIILEALDSLCALLIEVQEPLQ